MGLLLVVSILVYRGGEISMIHYSSMQKNKRKGVAVHPIHPPPDQHLVSRTPANLYNLIMPYMYVYTYKVEIA